MSLRIAPQEFHVLSDRYVIKTRVPKDDLRDEDITVRVRNANLQPGDAVTVQCMSHRYDELFWEADYRVVSRSESLRTHELNDRDIKQVTEVDYRVERVGEWWGSSLVPRQVPTSAECEDALDKMTSAMPTPVNSGAATVWNPGKKVHQVKVDGEVVFESADKAEAAEAAREWAA